MHPKDKEVKQEDYMTPIKVGAMDLQTLNPDFLGGQPYDDYKLLEERAGRSISGEYKKGTMFRSGKDRGMNVAIGMKGATQDISQEFRKLKSRADRDVELSEAYEKAEEVIGTKELRDVSKAGVRGEEATTRAMAGQDMYGAGGGGARERITSRIAGASEVEKQALKSGTSTLLGELAAADLQEGQKRKFSLEDQLMPGAEKVLKAQGFQAGMELRHAAATRPDINWQRQVVAMNNSQLNQAEYARHGFDVQMAAQNAQQDSQMVSTFLTMLALAYCDYNLKEDIRKMGKGLKAVRDIDLYEFVYKQGTPVGELPEGKRYGPMAQQVQEVMPEAVGKVNDYLAVDKDQIIWALFSAVKELDKKVQELEKGNNNE